MQATEALRTNQIKALYDGKSASQLYAEEVATDPNHLGVDSNNFVARKEWFDEHPEEVAFFLDVWQEGMDEWTKNSDQIIADYPEDFAIQSPEDEEFMQDYVKNVFNFQQESVYLTPEWIENEEGVFDLIQAAGVIGEDQTLTEHAVIDPKTGRGHRDDRRRLRGLAGSPRTRREETYERHARARCDARLRGSEGYSGSRAVARVVLSLLGGLSFLALWAALAEWKFPPIVLPSPFAVVDNMGVLIGEGLVGEAFLKSLQKTLMGWAAAMAIGIPIGLLMGRYRYARAFFHDLVYVLSNVPLVVYAVISLVVFGISDIGPAFVVMLLVLPAVSINVAAGVASADQGLLAMSRAFRARRGRR